MVSKNGTVPVSLNGLFPPLFLVFTVSVQGYRTLHQLSD